MKVKVLANERNELGHIVGGGSKTIYEADEDVEITLSPASFSMWCLKISRNGTPWLRVYISHNQMGKLRRKLRTADDTGIICPSTDPVPWPFGEGSDVFLSATAEGWLEVVKTPEWHRFIFEGDPSKWIGTKL